MVRDDGTSILDGDMNRSYDVWRATFSYTYLGYLFDLLEDTDPSTQARKASAPPMPRHSSTPWVSPRRRAPTRSPSRS